MIVESFKYAVCLPALLSIILLFLCYLFGNTAHELNISLLSLIPALSLFSAFTGLHGIPPIPPLDSIDWLWGLSLLIIPFQLPGMLVGKNFLKWVSRFLYLVLGSSLLIFPLLQNQTGQWIFLLWSGLLAGMSIAVLYCSEDLFVRTNESSVFSLSVISVASGSIITASAASFRLGILGVALATSMIPILIYRLITNLPESREIASLTLLLSHLLWISSMFSAGVNPMALFFIILIPLTGYLNLWNFYGEEETMIPVISSFIVAVALAGAGIYVSERGIGEFSNSQSVQESENYAPYAN